VMETLGNLYDLPEDEAETISFADALVIAASTLVEENLPDYAEQLSGLDESFDQSLYRQAVLCGVAYMMLSRCGVKPDALDMSWIDRFNSPALVNLLGAATSDIAEMGLREIAAVVLPLQKNSIRTFANEAQPVYTQTIPTETIPAEERMDGNEREQTDVHASGRLPAARSGPAAAAPGSPGSPQAFWGGDRGHVNRWGRARKQFLMEHKKALHMHMMTQLTLWPHLLEMQETAAARFDLLTTQMAEARGATEALKARDPMAWVGLMNMVRHSAEESVRQELIYS